MMIKAVEAKCNECPLKDNIFVPTEWNDSKIMIIAEAPGYQESIKGVPLVGDAGQELDKILKQIKVKRDFAIYANSVSCRPTKKVGQLVRNRTPTIEEIICCKDRLKTEIEQYDPLVIVTMGKVSYVAMNLIYQGKCDDVKMGSVVGCEFLYNKRHIIITYHPAAMLYSREETETGKRIRQYIKSALESALSKVMNKQLKLI